MKHTCPVCTRQVSRVYQFGQCKECTVEQLKQVRPLIDAYRSPVLNLMRRNLRLQGQTA